MEYTREELDRKTGDLQAVSLGNWITVAELATSHGIGRRQATEVLMKLDVLQPETEGRVTRHRLAPWFVDEGYGKRLKRKRDKFPFDVLSPAGQDWINEWWDDAVATIRRAKEDEPVKLVAEALARFKSGRIGEMTVQMQICWLADFFPGLTQEMVALVVGVSQPLVSKFLGIRSSQKANAQKLKTSPLPEIVKMPMRGKSAGREGLRRQAA
jgi:hypothetical protein